MQLPQLAAPQGLPDLLPLYVPTLFKFFPLHPFILLRADAEGNGDSISAAVQAERITLLENVLATQVEQTHMRKPAPAAPQLPRLPTARLLAHNPHSPASASFSFSADSLTRSAPLSPLSPTSPWADSAPARFPPPTPRAEDYAPPIYHTQVPEGRGAKAAGGSLLPGFLAGIVHSDAPSLSPSTSTSSAELSLDTDEYDELRRAAHFTYGTGPHRQPHGGHRDAARRVGSTNPLTIHEHSIWKLDGAELNLGGRGGGGQSHAAKPTTSIPRDLAHAHAHGLVGAGAGVQGLAAAVAALTIAPGPAPAGRR